MTKLSYFLATLGAAFFITGTCAQAMPLHNVFVGMEGSYAFSNSVNFKPKNSAGYETSWARPEDPFDNDIGRSPGYGLYVGYIFNPKISADISYNHRGKFSWKKWFDLPPNNTRQRKIDKIVNSTLMLNIYYSPQFNDKVIKPYINAGIGASRNKVGKMDSITYPSWPVGPGAIEGKTTTSFAWQIGVGTDITINQHVALNAGYRLVDLGKMSTGSILRYDNVIQTIPPVFANHAFLNELYFGILGTL